MTTWARRLLIANVVVFIVAPPPLGLLGAIPPQIVERMVLVPILVPVQPWTVLTYQFLHGGLLHLLFNMIILFFFGPRLELRLGGMHFLFLYLVSGIAGAALSVFTPTVQIVGASGALFGVLLGFARYWPRERIFIWGVLPVEARVLVLFLAGASLFFGVTGGGGNIAHLAHLGGFVGGWVYLKVLESRSPARRFKRRVESVAAPKVSERDLERWRQVDASALHPLNRAEFERVLGKAEAQGASALNPQERAFMERIAGR